MEKAKTSSLKEYENNPRNNDGAVSAVAASIDEFGFLCPIVIDDDGVILAGHTRLKAARRLGIDEVPIITAHGLSEEQKRAFRLADNKTAELAEWDMAMLDVELTSIENIDMDDFGFMIDDIGFDDEEEDRTGSLVDKFVVPPLSILDSRQGYWIDRKNGWKALGIASEVGREENLLGAGLADLGSKVNCKTSGTSIFDPVLCEIAYRWFCPDGGSVFDPFAGGSVRGIVAAKLGHEYTGIDLRREQVDANIANAEQIGVSPTWICDDSLNADEHIQDVSVDLLFSCPPYADLEVYSDDERDISNMEYEDFKQAYRGIIDIACRKVKPNRFAVFVVGDVRDKAGNYRDFIGYTKECFNANGFKTYNEMIFVEMTGLAAFRCSRAFNGTRKITKTHQNVLVFYNGDVKKIKDIYTELDPDELSEIIKKSDIIA